MFDRVLFALIIIHVINFAAFVHDAFGIFAVHFNRIGDMTCLTAFSAMIYIGRNIDTGIGAKCIRCAAFTRTQITQLPIIA